MGEWSNDMVNHFMKMIGIKLPACPASISTVVKHHAKQIDKNTKGAGSFTDEGLHYRVMTTEMVDFIIPSISDWVRTVLTKKVSEEIGKELELLSGNRGVNFNLTQDAGYEWHVDGEDVAFTGVIGIAVPKNGFLVLDLGQEVNVLPVSDNIVVFESAKILHKVMPTKKPRITLVVGWKLKKTAQIAEIHEKHQYSEKTASQN